MDINAAIQAHSQWKVTLRKVIATGQAPEKDPGNDRLCAVGQWIAAGNTFPELDQAHRDFHAVAAKVYQLSKTNKAAAEALLDGEFTQRSLKVVGLLRKLSTRKAA